jgi:hypothetical protein
MPADSLWDDCFDAPGMELAERAQPLHQERKSF